MSTHGYDTFVKLEELDLYARDSAKTLVAGTAVSPAYTALNAEKKLSIIKSVMHSATGYAEVHVSIPQEVEWLLDNWYIAEREGKCAISDLKTSHRLKSVLNKRRRLIISEASLALIQSGAGTVTSERIKVFLDAFQDIICLSEAELAFFIPALRLELIACLANACQKLRYVISDGIVEDGLASYFGRLFTSLRFLSGFDASNILESVNRVERTLRRDPAGIYTGMDEQTRYSYRREISRLADQTGDSEHQMAIKILTLSQKNNRHIGFYIFPEPLGSVKHGRTGALYISFIILSSLFLSLLVSFMLDEPVISLLLLLPVSEFVKNITDYFVLRFCHPQRIQRLELADGVPDEGRTLCVISILLSSADSGRRAAGLLEEYRLCNRDAGKNLLFGILADLPDSKAESAADDARFIGSAKDEIDRLNTEYGGGFFLFCRSRRYNAQDKKYTAWERKRGAILELCRFLKGSGSQLKCIAGQSEALDGTNYVITLDSDTRLNAGSARELIGAAMHPLNRPIIDTNRGIVLSGSGIIQPRISVDLTSAGQTRYTKIFAGLGGIDPYGGMTSDIYQNLFGAGSFAGKGIIDIDAYLTCLDHRFPENSVLSHDLLEGAYLRCAFAGDIELTDGFPAKVTTYYDRMHRWTRGDWQSLPWLCRKVKSADGNMQKNCLGQVDRWKIADNLRRSLVPVFTFAALAAGMLMHNNDFLFAAFIAVLSAVSHLIISSTASVFTKKCGRVRYHSTVMSGPGGQFLQTVIRLILLPYEAYVCFSAILTALFRMYISHRHLLAWVTAADSERRSKNNILTVMKRLWPSCLTSAVIAVFTRFPAAAVVSIIWVLSPLLVIYLSRDIRKQENLEPQERLILSRCAGDIWRYFDELITREGNYLP
ncbi:MAG: hypothetical protein GX936_06500, partial [Clostridiales bacterium]|nr:hypothetical protein [Clostridiales bacterium]